MRNRWKIAIAVIIAIVIICAIIIPVVIVSHQHGQNIATKATATTYYTTPRPTNDSISRPITDPIRPSTTPTPSTEVLTNPDTCPNVQTSQRFDCFPDTDKQNQNQCLARGCCWIPTNVANAPSCFFPANYPTYTATEQNVTYGRKFILTRNQRFSAHYSSPMNNVNLQIQYQTSNRLRVKVSQIIFILFFPS